MNALLVGLGGCREVGRSAFLLDAGEKFLLDCGIKLTPEGTEYPSHVDTNIAAAIISHAHLDHSGNLPHLFLKSNPLCYMTPPTLELAEILWHDTLKIAGIEGTVEKFSKEEIRRTKRYSFPLGYKRKIEISPNVSLEFFNAGHILGAAMTRLEFKSFSFLYTGDFKAEETRLHEKADLKTGKNDFVLMESTYGDRDHPDRLKEEKAFVERVKETVEGGGHALIPAFAVGRSQEIVDVLFEHKVKFPVFLDGMSQKAALVSLKYPEYLKAAKQLRNSHKKVEWVRTKKDRLRALDEPSAIVTTAGMLEGGPILSYIKQLWNDPSSSILITGYQVDGTQGKRLLEEGVIHIDGRDYKVECLVEKFDFSAHASQTEMVESVKKWSPRQVLLVHGEFEKAMALKKRIKEESGIDTVILERDKPHKLDLS
ncbi:MAG: MBL fold metallo-hydrolase [Candidatus Diapherotrites archaeon]